MFSIIGVWKGVLVSAAAGIQVVEDVPVDHHAWCAAALHLVRSGEDLWAGPPAILLSAAQQKRCYEQKSEGNCSICVGNCEGKRLIINGLLQLSVCIIQGRWRARIKYAYLIAFLARGERKWCTVPRWQIKSTFVSYRDAGERVSSMQGAFLARGERKYLADKLNLPLLRDARLGGPEFCFVTARYKTQRVLGGSYFACIQFSATRWRPGNEASEGDVEPRAASCTVTKFAGTKAEPTWGPLSFAILNCCRILPSMFSSVCRSVLRIDSGSTVIDKMQQYLWLPSKLLKFFL